MLSQKRLQDTARAIAEFHNSKITKVKRVKLPATLRQHETKEEQAKDKVDAGQRQDRPHSG